mmetsp:Transcript_53067/g.147729  ORF Transcript_53067/g.147729 Transcript_53067/m.147729 type:complete len:229 (-) Transcript_53067:899-1585(-)
MVPHELDGAATEVLELLCVLPGDLRTEFRDASVAFRNLAIEARRLRREFLGLAADKTLQLWLRFVAQGPNEFPRLGDGRLCVLDKRIDCICEGNHLSRLHILGLSRQGEGLGFELFDLIGSLGQSPGHLVGLLFQLFPLRFDFLLLCEACLATVRVTSLLAEDAYKGFEPLECIESNSALALIHEHPQDRVHVANRDGERILAFREGLDLLPTEHTVAILIVPLEDLS